MYDVVDYFYFWCLGEFKVHALKMINEAKANGENDVYDTLTSLKHTFDLTYKFVQ